MHEDNTKRLFDEFPELFDRELLPHGFECQDGWFELLFEFAGRIRDYCKQCSEHQYPEVILVKQVMGGLRFLVHGGAAPIKKMIQDAHRQSTRICELDGEPAIGLFVCAPHWYRYLCKTCADLHECMSVEDYSPEDSEYVSVPEIQGQSAECTLV